MDTRVAYTCLVAAVAVERLGELYLSQRNRRRALAQGAIETGAGHYPWMVGVHTAFLLACPAEVWLLQRPFRPTLAAVTLVLLAGSMALRYWAVLTLGERWNTRVLCLPGVPAVASGPYRFLRHPNYLAVVVELVALPLVHGAWLTALLFSVANAFLLRVRIRVEEQALGTHADYAARLAGRPRLVPGGR